MELPGHHWYAEVTQIGARPNAMEEEIITVALR